MLIILGDNIINTRKVYQKIIQTWFDPMEEVDKMHTRMIQNASLIEVQ